MGRDPATTDRRCARARLRLVALLMPAPCGCPPETFVSRVVMKRQNASFMSSFTASTAFLLNLSRMIPTAYRRASMDAVFSTARMPRNKVARKGLPWWLAMVPDWDLGDRAVLTDPPDVASSTSSSFTSRVPP